MRPFSLHTWGINPHLQVFLDFGEINEEVFSRLDNWSWFTNCAEVVFHLGGWVKQFLAFVTLVASSIGILAKRTSPSNEAIRQEKIAFFTITLSHLLLLDFPIFVYIQEYLLTNLSMPLSGGSSKVVKADIKPFVNSWVDLMIMVTNLFWCFFLLHCFYFGRRAVLIGPTNVEHIVSLKSFKPGIDIGRKHTSDNISQMRDIVHIWQCRCDQDVVFVCIG